MNRRKFLRITGTGIASTAILPPANRLLAESPTTIPASATVEARIRTGPYLQNPTTDAITIMWMTTVPGYGYVEYGPTEALGLRADAELNGLRQANNVLHRVRLAGLQPGATYFYRVTFKPISTFQPYKIAFGPDLQTKISTFTTFNPHADRTRFVMFNDLHDNVAQWKKLHGYVADQQFDFALLNGDVTDFMQDEKQMVEHFLDPCTEMFAQEMPFLYTRGNHETRGAFAREMEKYLAMPNDRFYYSFTHGRVRFVVLDSGEDKADNSPVYAGLCDFDAYRAMQQKFLEKEVQSDEWKNAGRRIAIFHIPGYHSDNQHTTLDVRKWHSVLNDVRTDLYLGGHTHVYTIAKADPAQGYDYPLVIGGGPKWGKGTVTTVDIDNEHIRVKMLRDDGVQVGELIV